MKLNELICPKCGMKMLTNCSYATCDACNTFFYASQMKKGWWYLADTYYYPTTGGTYVSDK